MSEIAERVRATIAQSTAPASQKELARRIGITPDAFSRALSGERRFSAGELAEVAEILGADLHWLITGNPDPHRLVVAARHSYDREAGRHVLGNRDADEQALQDVALAYRQVFKAHPPAMTDLPRAPADAAQALGDKFVRSFADRLEERLRIDVVRLAGLSTAWSTIIAGRRVVLIPPTPNWFHENWSLAHELAHLAHGDHEAHAEPGGPAEMAANAYAAELLLPEQVLRSMDWEAIAPEQLASLVWELGVSTSALATRLNALGITTSPQVRTLLGQATQRVLRRHWAGDGAEITRRMSSAAQRRFPFELEQAHLVKVEEGELLGETLAWILGVPPGRLDVAQPAQTEEISADDLVAALGL